MSKPASAEFLARMMGPNWDQDIEQKIAWFRAAVEHNKTRRRRGDPPAALPVPATSPKGGGWSGGAAAALEYDGD